MAPAEALPRRIPCRGRTVLRGPIRSGRGGLSKTKVKAAVKKVGNSRAKVETSLKK
ncbi:DUF3606 domain-containing protein [Rhizobium leguminosarum]|uniref:DUF3606 domain-containing protein n=1 Tax=Rhizobium TaxID=379 RepID=UPI0009B76808|nr:DUF3606 domain-containing protein [Rhizobium leguminosarum]